MTLEYLKIIVEEIETHVPLLSPIEESANWRETSNKAMRVIMTRCKGHINPAIVRPIVEGCLMTENGYC